MKNKLLALFASLGMSGFAFGDIQIGENVTIKGFIDASYHNVNSDGNSDTSDLSLDEAEIDFLFNSGSVSARMDIDTGSQGLNSADPTGGTATDGLGIEQAHFTYTTDGGLSVTVGRMGTLLGFEREDPAGLYTFSRAYSNVNFNLGNIDGAGLYNRHDGVRFGYSTDSFTVNVSVDQNVNQDLDSKTGNNDDDDSRLNYEIAVAFTGVENLNLGIGYRNDRSEDARGVLTNSAEDADILNIHAAYTAGKALLAAEYTTLNAESAGVRDLDAYMLLLDYDFTEKLGGAVRYSKDEDNAGGLNRTNTTKWTIAPNYAITENLGAIAEFSSVNPDGANNDSTEFAVELTYTF